MFFWFSFEKKITALLIYAFWREKKK